MPKWFITIRTTPQNDQGAGGMELGLTLSKQPASAAGLVHRQFDEVLKGVDAEDDAVTQKSFVKWQRKEYQTVQNELIRRLDEALPQNFDRTLPGKSARLESLVERCTS